MLKCAAIFTDHMVLVRDKKICVWGECDEEGVVEVYIDGCQACTKIVDNKWKVYLPEHAVGGPYLMKVVCGSDSIEFTDVYYGEVFLASGQSNMEMELKDSKGGKEEAKQSNYPLIRYYNVLKTGYIDDVMEKEIRSVQWESCVGEISGRMSAVAYYAAKTLYEELQIPVGIIDCYQGGTSISSWLPEDILNRYEIGKKHIVDYKALVGDKTDEEYEIEVEEYWKVWHAWDDKVQELKRANPDVSWDEIISYAGESPWPQPAGNKSVFRPTGCYGSMIKTVAAYTLSGVFYYQGETDAENVEGASAYYDLMQALIGHWRDLFENRELYFVITQLPMYIEKDVADDCSWAVMREQQLKIYESIRNVGLLGIADCGEYGNIHPVDKKTPGERLGELVLEEYFGRHRQGKAMLPGAIYKQDGKIVIECSNTYGKIHVIKEELTGSVGAFEIAGLDEIYRTCEYYVDGNCIVLPVESDLDIQYVRYAWCNYTNLEIFNSMNIPLVPFGARKIQ